MTLSLLIILPVKRSFSLFSHPVMSDSVTPWTVARQVPLSMGFPRQEYWNGLPFPFPADLLHPRIKPGCPALAGGFFTTEPTWFSFGKQWSWIRFYKFSKRLRCNSLLIVIGILQARILEWVAIPFSRGSSQLKDRTNVSCIAGRFFTVWATREALSVGRNPEKIHRGKAS